MKVLEISNNKGYYYIDKNKYEIIDIDKDKIYKILDLIFESSDPIEMDKEDEQNKILNEAEKVIYNGILEYLENFITEKPNIKKEIDNEFSEIKEILEMTTNEADK